MFRPLVLAVAFAVAPRCGPEPVRLATFNIEDFPRNERQVVGAFAAIRTLDAPVVAVQEITNPAAFRAAAARELGSRWVAVTSEGDHHRLGWLVDTERATLLEWRVRPETRVIPGAKPTLEARVRVGDQVFRLLNVHLKAGRGHHAVRAAQIERLAALVQESNERVVVLGDFNASTAEDRVALAGLAESTGLAWASERLACTAIWQEPAHCVSAALDHVFAAPSTRVSAAAACADGCRPTDRCPLWREQVSDHCPIQLEL